MVFANYWQVSTCPLEHGPEIASNQPVVLENTGELRLSARAENRSIWSFNSARVQGLPGVCMDNQPEKKAALLLLLLQVLILASCVSKFKWICSSSCMLEMKKIRCYN